MSKDNAKEYAIALFDLSLEKKNVEIIKDELIIVSNAFSEEEQFGKLLSHPKLSKEEKKGVITKVFKGINDTLLYFLLVVIENDRVNDLTYITDEFMKLYHEYNTVLLVLAKTTIPLSETQINALQNKLSIKYRHKIKIENEIDPSIIGGMQLIIDNEIIDYTIQNQLHNLKTYILKHS